MQKLQLRDAQQAALGFLVSQTSHIERQVWEKKYPDITYPEFVPVDNSAHPWATSITYYSTDKVGKMERLHHRGRDFPKVDLSREKHEEPIVMHGIGYDYDLEEINQAQMLGINLTADKAMAARRAYEEGVEEIAFTGDAKVGRTGLINNASVSAAEVADPDDVGVNTTWETKTAEHILTDVDAALTGIWINSNTVEMADTVLLPLASLALINRRRIDPTSDITILSWIKKNNTYTMTTGKELKVKGLRQLATAGNGGTKRMVAYRRDPEVLKLHIPMPLQFLAPQGPYGLTYEVPGMCRIGYVDIRRPGGVRYSDNI